MLPVLRGPDGFERYYADLFTARWLALRAALLEPVRHAAWKNPFAETSQPLRGTALSGAFPGLPSSLFENCTLPDEPAAPGRDVNGLATFYALDPASVIPPRLLAPRPGEAVGDLCAAPGGKALLLAERLAPDATLWLNDRSRARLARLRRVLTDYLPAALAARVAVTSFDAARFGLHRPASFDALLLDVPCSSERHVLKSTRALGQWSRARVERLAQQQYAILAAAVAALKPGGRLVYCTCALARAENDGVVERIVESRRHRMLRASPAGFDRAVGAELEPTELGFRVLPDRSGAGPLYFALLRKPG